MQGVCDCHIHIIGPAAAYPMSPGRDYTPPEADVHTYQPVCAALGIERAVVIQPSVYGQDLSCTRNAIRASGGRWRGIAVLPPDADNPEIADLHAEGFRGVRFNLLHGATLDLDALETTARRIAPYGWHVELASRPEVLDGIAGRLLALPVDVVVDHLARLAPDAARGDAKAECVLKLLASGKVWIKLAGAYVVSRAGSPYADLDALARMLIAARPDRLVWGTNWPHPRRELTLDDNLQLRALMNRWCRDAATTKAILVDNAAQLYDF